MKQRKKANQCERCEEVEPDLQTALVFDVNLEQVIRLQLCFECMQSVLYANNEETDESRNPGSN